MFAETANGTGGAVQIRDQALQLRVDLAMD
jgi:hypothetical protein